MLTFIHINNIRELIDLIILLLLFFNKYLFVNKSLIFDSKTNIINFDIHIM